MSLDNVDSQISTEAMRRASSAFWAATSDLLVDGSIFSFHEHEYQIEPMNSLAPVECARKGAQIGWTTITMLKSMHRLINRVYKLGVLYLFPTRDDVLDFSKGRFNPLVTDNLELSKHIMDTDAANIKRVGRAMLYFRGMKSRSQLKSVPVDLINFDELDEMDPKMVDLALERLSHSETKHVSYISTPTLPDYGIDVKWQRSTQNLWMIKCKGCGNWTCLEKEFEDRGWENQKAILQVRSGSNGGFKAIRSCTKCEREIYPRDGTWVESYPDRKDVMVGRWISQLNSLRVDPMVILEAFQDPKRSVKETYNSKIGMPYVEAYNRISIDDVYKLCSNMGIQSSDIGPCSMGVDQGKGLHVVIGRRDSGKKGRIVYLNELKDWSELDKLMKGFNVYRCVVDAMPEMRNARAFAERFPGRVFLNYYNEHQKGGYRWNEETLTVSSNRTESLDASHKDIMDEQVVLPKRCDVLDDFAKHMHSVAKKLEEDDETGSKRYVYLKLGADHYRHAFNYECMARHYALSSVFM